MRFRVIRWSLWVIAGMCSLLGGAGLVVIVAAYLGEQTGYYREHEMTPFIVLTTVSTFLVLGCAIAITMSLIEFRNGGNRLSRQRGN